MNAHLIMAIAGFGGAILAVFVLMVVASGWRPGGSNGGTDVSQWWR